MKWLRELFERPEVPKCKSCDGSGVVTVGWEWFATVCPCSHCEGTGRTQASPTASTSGMGGENG